MLLSRGFSTCDLQQVANLVCVTQPILVQDRLFVAPLRMIGRRMADRALRQAAWSNLMVRIGSAVRAAAAVRTSAVYCSDAAMPCDAASGHAQPAVPYNT